MTKAQVKNVAPLLILNEIRLRDGISINLVNGDTNPTTGYMVSIEGHTESFDTPNVDSETIEGYIDRHWRELYKEGNYLGIWRDYKGIGVPDQYVFDVSQNVIVKRDAVFLGIARKQKAIWDCKNKDEIRLKQKQHGTRKSH